MWSSDVGLKFGRFGFGLGRLFIGDRLKRRLRFILKGAYELGRPLGYSLFSLIYKVSENNVNFCYLESEYLAEIIISTGVPNPLE